MKKYLSIGEVSKLKGVGIKSLRYYDELGILKPAYVNPETNYRYYTLDQLVTLDIIFICIEFGIPLKALKQYEVDERKFDLALLLKDGNRIAEEKIASIKAMQKKLQCLSDNMDTLKEVKTEQGTYKRYFKERYFLTLTYTNPPEDIHSYAQATTELFYMCQNLGCTNLPNQGILHKYTETGIETYAFIEITPPNTLTKDILSIPPGEYECTLYPNSQIPEMEELIRSTPSPQGTTIVCMELLDIHLESEPSYVEMQHC